MISLHVVADEQGNILAAVKTESGYGEDPTEIGLIPAAGQTLHFISLPEESTAILDSLGKFYVKVESGQPKLTKRSD